MKRLFTSITLLFIVGLVFSIACSSEPEVIVEEKIVEVEKEVIKEVPVREKTPTPQAYYNASGDEIKQNANEGRVFIFLGFVILGVAILYKK